MNTVKRRVSRWVAAVGIAGTVLLAVGAFSLSFTSLTHLAVRSGVAEAQAWEWPLIVDGVIVVATVSVVALAGRKGTGYGWALLACAALVSIGGNAAQAVRLPTEEPAWIAAAVATVPPIVLLAATHMTVILTRPEQDPAAETPNTGTHTATPAHQTTPPIPGAAEHAVGPASPAVAWSRDDPGQVVRDSGTPTAPPTVLGDLDDRDAPPVLAPTRSGGDRPAAEAHPPAFGDESSTFRAEKAHRLRTSGWSTAEIAQELGVSTGSVRRYLKPLPTTIDEPTGADQ